jgi:hypothetical protein
MAPRKHIGERCCAWVSLGWWCGESDDHEIPEQVDVVGEEAAAAAADD